MRLANIYDIVRGGHMAVIFLISFVMQCSTNCYDNKDKFVITKLPTGFNNRSTFIKLGHM